MNYYNIRKLPKQIIWAVILLLFDLLYLILVGVALTPKMELVSNRGMQYCLHITVILSAFIYSFFVNSIYQTENNKISAKLAFIFSCLFTIPIFIGRIAGIIAISSKESTNNVFNFYGNVSISRNIEIVSWTILFPISVLFLASIFYMKGKIGAVLGGLCLISAICCFIAFMCLFSSNIIFLMIGLLGWGVLFILIIIMYIIYYVRISK